VFLSYKTLKEEKSKEEARILQLQPEFVWKREQELKAVQTTIET
jgi:hypothetical protein